MNGQPVDTQWYIARDGKQHGPLTDIEMRTFVAHSYLRPADLIWRPGMAEWLPAPQVFPAVFQAPAPAAAPAPSVAPHAPAAPAPATTAQPSTTAHTSDFDKSDAADDVPKRSMARRLATAAAVISIIGGGAFALTTYREPLLELVTGAPAKPPIVKVEAPPPPADPAPAPAVAAVSATPAVEAPVKPADAAPAEASVAAAATTPSATATAAATPAPETQTAALTPPEPPAPPPFPPNIDGSQIDARLQKIPVWAMIKKDYPDWYVGHIAAAEKMVTDKRPEGDVAMHLAQGLVTLRRQNSEKALAASPDKLRRVASAFLENLKSLQTQSVSACYGYISKGETSPAVVQLMQAPETATAFNANVGAIFDAIQDGAKSPAKHAAAVKGDYDVLIKELGKIGWKEDDLQTFSNPKLLSKRPPEQVCKMVLDWFSAHLAVKDKGVQDRLLYETLKPVVSG
jgi:GYF domain 2